MSPVSLDPRRPTGAATGAPRWERIFVDIFTKHPFAKGFSVLLGCILVVLIDRELQQVIFDEAMTLTTTGSGARHEIVIVLPPEYVVEEIMPPRVVVRVTGRNKERDRIRLPLEATIPAERLIGVDKDPNLTSTIGLERADIRLPDLNRPVIAMNAVTLKVTKLEIRDLPLAHQEIPKEAGYDLAVVFQPPTLQVRGPASVFQDPGLTTLRFDVDVPESPGIPRTQTYYSLPEPFLRKKIRPVDDRIEIVATVRRVPRDELGIELSLKIHIAAPLDTAYVFTLDPPYELGFLNVTLVGPKQEVERHRADPKELEADLNVVVYAQRAAERLQAKIDADTDPAGVQMVANATIPPHLLNKYQLRIKDKEDNLLQVPIKVRKKS